jgi:hypothetical protein
VVFRKTPEERKAWWNSLSQEEQAEHVNKWERKRDSPDREEVEITPLSAAEKREINATMRRIGMEDCIVLFDENGKAY